MPLSLIERYRDRLPVGPETPVVSLGEGSTPLLPAPRLSERYGAEIWLKCEGLNPTGSFKDRGMTVAVSKALEDGARAVVCASTGNTSASAAAYAARAGLQAIVLVAESAARGGAAGGAGRPRPRELAQPEPRRGAEDRCVRDRRGARRRARRVRPSL